MSEQRWIALPGTRFRCTPFYQPAEELDPLAKLYLEALESEHNVSRLVRAFGLPGRIVEDVLGDLIRRNRAILVVQNNVYELRPIAEALPSVAAEAGETIDVWQDDSTGLLLAAPVVDWFDRQHDADDGAGGVSMATLKTDHRLVEQFLKAPDAHLIDVLMRADPESRERDGASSILDRLSDRYRVRRQTLWLPFVEADILGITIPIITTDEIPTWMTRVWSVAMRGEALSPIAELDFYLRSMTDTDNERVVHSWRAHRLAARWRDAVDDFLRLVPPPVSGYDLRDVRTHQASLTGLIGRASRFELSDALRGNDGGWCEAALACRHWAVLVATQGRHVNGMLASIRRLRERGEPLPTSVVVVTPPAAAEKLRAAQVLEAFGPAVNVCCVSRALSDTAPAVAFGDASDVCAQWSPGGAAVVCGGYPVVADWLSLVQALPSPKGSQRDDHWLPPVRLPRGSETVAPIGDSTIPDVIEDVRSFSDGLLTAIVDPQVALEGEGSLDADAKAAVLQLDRRKPFSIQFPFLGRHCEDLSYRVSQLPTPPWAFWTRIVSAELLPLTIAVLTEPRRRAVEGSIDVLSNADGRALLDEGWTSLLRELTVERRWKVRIGVRPNSGAAHDLDRSLAEVLQRVRSPLLTILTLRSPAPAAALLIDNLVFLSSSDWLAPFNAQRNSADFGFAIESQHFADDLRTAFASARTVAPLD